MYLGSWKIDDFLTFPCNTHKVEGDAFDADAPPTYRIYEDETVTPVLTGSLAILDDDNTLGFYTERIQLLTANFTKGKTYTIYITGTVDSKIGTMSHMFQIEAEINAASVWAVIIEGTKTALGFLRLILSALALKTSGGGTPTLKSRDLADSKDRVVLTVDDKGNRTDVELDEL